MRERADDVTMIAKAFLRRYGVEHGKPRIAFAPEALRALRLHTWTGNVRELQNLVRRIVLLGADAAVADEFPRLRPWPPDDAAAQAAPVCDTDAVWNVSLKEHARMAARDAERALILRTLEQTHWNRKEAASLLRISYKALLKKLREWNPQNSRDH